MAVTRCICLQRSFRDIALQARSRGWTHVDEVLIGTGAGTGCGSCRPYLEAVLTTGHTCFSVASPGHPPQPTEPSPWD